MAVQSNKEGGKEIRVDKDVELVKEHFHLDHLDYEDMSPVLIPGGYTKVSNHIGGGGRGFLFSVLKTFVLNFGC